MNEKLQPDRQTNAEGPTLREKVEGYLRLIVVAPLIGSGPMGVVDQELEKRQEKPPVEFTIPSGVIWHKIGGGYEKFNMRISDRAQKFLEQNPIDVGASVSAGAEGADYLKRFKEIWIDMSPYDESTVVFYYFNKDGKGGKRVQIRPTGGGKFERHESDF